MENSEFKIKKRYIILFVSMMFIWMLNLCNGGGTESYGGKPSIMITNTQCIGCVDKETAKMYGRYASNYDSEGVMGLLISGKAYMIASGQECVVVELGGLYTKVRVSTEEGYRVEVYIPTSFLDKK